MELSAAAERNLEALVGELEALSKILRFAADQFRARPADERRPTARIALNALSNFVGNVFSLDQDLRQPLNELLYGLDDLDHGQVVPLLKPAKVSHRAKGALSTGFLRAGAAALMDLHRQDGMPRKEAARHVASKLNERGYRDDKGGRIAAKEVERWRDEMKSPQDRGDLAVGHYSFMLERLKSRHPGAPNKAAEFLFDVLPDMIAPSIPKNPQS